MAHWDPRLPVTSSEEPAWPPGAEDCYREAILALLAAGPDVPFVVGGAFAIHHHTGIWRTTKDLDFFMVPRAVPEAFRRLRAVGFTTSVEDPVWLAKACRGEHFVDLITGVGNACLAVEPSWIDRGPSEIVLGIPCRILAAEECLATKCFVAFRERFDGADIVHLIRACGPSLDWDRILALMDGHWELLYWSLVLYAYVYPAHTDAVPGEVWAGLTRRFAESVRHPDRTAPFRGSLVDPRMFSINVEEWGERNLYQEFCDRHPFLLREENLTGGKS
ncbi:MAG TPA: hypothetical protein VG267_01680 [Terracidiphilus sp.]|nr:hypothetical protein [Terracidiphilus sp.]